MPIGMLLVMLLGMTLGSCAYMPRELNLTPIWFHRLDEQGNLLEADALWPIVHYERTTDGGHDFRLRPLYRRVTEPQVSATEHQFLWPFGRVRSDAEETSQRLFPLWSHRSRLDRDGNREVDWHALFPFFWGGSNETGDEDYLAFFPFYADIPQFLSYDRFRTLLFPLWVGLDKEGHHHSQFLWPFIGVSSCAEGGHDWFRILPFYGHDIDPGRHDRRFLLWPFVHWGYENEDSDDPVWTFSVWPLFGVRSSREVSSLSLLWPLFEKTSFEGRFYKLNVLWPFFHYYEEPQRPNAPEFLTELWLFPFFGRARSDRLDNWSFLWPLIWWRDYNDPDGRLLQQWVLPLYWHIEKLRNDGSSEDHSHVFPLFHSTVARDAAGNRVGGEFSLPSPLPWRNSNGAGFEENYGFLWQVLSLRQRSSDDHATNVLGRVFTRRERAKSTTMSVPWLFNYERDANGKRTLRLLQWIPIGLSAGESDS
jgi:hypothetical protein